MSLTFRNLDVAVEDPVEQWGFEGVLSAVERGDLRHWRRIAAALRRAPRGKVAAELREVLDAVENPAIVHLFERVLALVVEESQTRERAAVAERLRDSMERAGLTRAEFARRLGTSQSRLSTYLTGRVVPSAVILLRAEAVAAEHYNSVTAGP